MPTYNFGCESCGEQFERMLRISQCDVPQDCPACQSTARRMFTPNEGGFILAGDSWTGKNISIGNQMRKKNQRLDKKQDVVKREAAAVSLVPNVDGERVDTWSEAKKLAASKGKDTTTYDSVVRKEKSL